MAKVLDGIRIADLSHALAAPSGTKLLGDLGAEVVKVERIGAGDFTRRLVPWVFESFNRSKKSVAVDLKSAEGIDVVRRLVASSDVFVQAFRPGVAEAMGLGQDDLAALNPRLIYATFSGFGPDGPEAERRGFDGLLQAESGMVRLQDRILGSTSFVDQAAGLLLSNAILSALLHRERTGEVSHVHVSLLDTALYLQTAPILEYSVTGHQLDQTGHAERNPTNAVFAAADGQIYIAVFFDDEWAALCHVLGLGELVTDPRFLTLADRQANSAALRELVGPELARHPRRFLVEELEQRGIVAGEVRDYGEVLANAQVKASGSIQALPTASGAEGAFVRTPFRLSCFPDRSAAPAPRVGQNTLELLASLGYSDDEQAGLRARGVVA
jgi:CoA:oxalate CoA-transferase